MNTSVVMRETKWALLALVLPVLLLHLGFIAATDSPVAPARQLLFQEDACPYLSCFWLGLVIYALVSLGRLARQARAAG